jgi:abortive infection bacteriophage resistance protein
MGKIATNTIVQIETLKDRGMDLDFSEDKVKEFLLDIGYYRLGFYWYPFEVDNDHNFDPGTKFSDVINLYYLDVDLRNLLLKYTSRIEINFRTKVVYYVSNKFKTSPTWFADPAIMKQEFLEDIDRLYSDSFINRNKPIKKHHAKYINDKYAPAWKTLEYFTFGNILNIYRNIKDFYIRERIANEFGIKKLDKFINFMDTVLLVRNSSAHGDVLFDLNAPKGISVIPPIAFNNNNRSSLDSCIKVISYILGHISVNRQNELEQSIESLFNPLKSNAVLKRIIENEINYQYKV